MSGVGVLTVLTVVGVGGLLLAASGWLQPTPPLSRVVAHLQRQPTTPTGDRREVSTDRWVGPVVEALRGHPRFVPSASDLAVVGRPLEQHVLWLLLSAFAGFAIPALLLSLLQSTAAIGVGWYVPLVLAMVGAMLGAFILHTATVDEAARIKSDLRYQVSAYLDVVTMLLAGNTGYEGALEQAAHAGDGRLFVELRRRIRDAGARGASLTEALRRTGVDLGLDELEQIAATAALSAAEGAPVARTLAAKCATLRSALASEQESEARLRTSRLTTPIVGMSLIFMALVIYPALSLT
jgi:tight adherence protein C